MNPLENKKTEREKSYEKISQTALLTAYPRIFTDIRFSKEIFDELERARKEKGLSEVPAELKVPKLAPELEARYKLVDRLLRQNSANQILEIAAGLSPRGMERSKDSSIEYVEVELPNMLKEKKAIAGKLIKVPGNLHFEEGNALNLDDLRKATSYFQKDKKITVVNEGLLRYLNFEEKAAVARNIHILLETFGGAWITSDITLKKFLQAQNVTMPGKNQKIAKLTGIKIDQNRFENEEEAQKFFGNLGFIIERHSLLEIQNELVSPRRLNISQKEVEIMIGSAVIYVMRLTSDQTRP